GASILRRPDGKRGRHGPSRLAIDRHTRMDHRERMAVPQDYDRAGTESFLMETPSWHRVKEIIEAVLARAPAARAALILEMCGDDASLRAEVESLLAAIEEASRFIERPALQSLSPSM